MFKYLINGDSQEELKKDQHFVIVVNTAAPTRLIRDRGPHGRAEAS